MYTVNILFCLNKSVYGGNNIYNNIADRTLRNQDSDHFGVNPDPHLKPVFGYQKITDPDSTYLNNTHTVSAFFMILYLSKVQIPRNVFNFIK